MKKIFHLHLLLPLTMMFFLVNCGGNSKQYKVSFSIPIGATMYEENFQTIKKGKLATKPKKDPYRPGYKFTGWYNDESCSTYFDFETTHIKTTTTIYSGWEEDAKFAVPLCFTSNVDGNTLLESKKFYYKTDLTDEWELGDGKKSITLNNNDKVYIACDGVYSYIRGNILALPDLEFNASGNIMSLISHKDFEFLYKIENDRQFYLLFASVASDDRTSKLVDASELLLPATNLSVDCYDNMFSNCEFLEHAPELPANKLSRACYREMLMECKALTSSPELPARELAPYCYNYMFNRSSLETAPELPATTLAIHCYEGMFSQCLLTSSPELPATTLKNACYCNMFDKCKSLASAPELPATTLANNCYNNMFNECVALRVAPDLPATNLENNCYQEMFAGCRLLNTPPALPATTLKESCYSGMFAYCISLKTAPNLPASKLEKGCYNGMFCYCELMKVTENDGAHLIFTCPSVLPDKYSVIDMFYGCISSPFRDTPTPGNSYYWN